MTLLSYTNLVLYSGVAKREAAGQKQVASELKKFEEDHELTTQPADNADLRVRAGPDNVQQLIPLFPWHPTWPPGGLTLAAQAQRSRALR